MGETVTYTLELPDGHRERFELELDPADARLLGEDSGDLPEWTALAYEQCPNCPLDPATTTHCPAAAKLVRVVEGVTRVYAHEEVDVTVETQRRTVSAHTTVQGAVGSVMGLIMATSGCPHLTFFRPMARFHLPFASPDETIYRATATYLLAQYVRRMVGGEGEFDLDGLAAVYAEVQEVNRAFANRLRSASETDGAVNALVALDVFAQIMPMAIEDQLIELRELFQPFLDAEADRGL